MNTILNRKFIILITLSALAILVLVIVVGSMTSPQPTEPEGTGTVTIGNTDELRTILLVEQYAILLDDMVSFVQQNIGKDIDKANIDSLSVQADNSIKMEISIPEKNKKITMVVERPLRSLEKLIVKVQEYNYAKTLKPY